MPADCSYMAALPQVLLRPQACHVVKTRLQMDVVGRIGKIYEF